MADLIGRYTNRLEDKPGDFKRKLLSASLAPVGGEREALETRRAELRRSLTPTPGKQANDCILLLISGAPAFGMSERETEAKVLLYAEALAGEPTWAIEQARQRFAKGGWVSPWDGKGCPSSANVVAECRAITLAVEQEIYKLSQVLDAEIVDNDTTADERKKVLADWAVLRTQLQNTNDVTEDLNERANTARAEQLRANQRVREREQAALDDLKRREERRLAEEEKA